MLAAMIPIGTALQTTGLSDVISSNISFYAANMSLFWLLFLILIVTMATTDIINNAATAVIMAPISAGIAIELGYDIEPFLMVVAVGASCAFLTGQALETDLIILFSFMCTMFYLIGCYNCSTCLRNKDRNMT